MSKNNAGFTIVELLIIIVVIGILAAITIVAYTGIQQRAQAATVQSDIEGAAKQIAMDQVTTSAYPATVALANNGAGLKASPGTTYQYAVNNTANPQTYCITATNNTTSYFISSTNNVPTSGACPGQGAGGVAAITNLIINPKLALDTNGWSVNGPAGSVGTASRQTTGGPTGISTFYRYATTTAPTASPLSIMVTPTRTSAIPVTYGTTYAVSAYMRTSCSLGNGFRIDTFFYNSTGTQVASHTTDTTVSAVNSWKFVTSKIAPQTSDSSYMAAIVVYSGPSTCPASSTYDATGVMATQGTTQYNYADGDSPNWIWNGTLNASTSTGPPI